MEHGLPDGTLWGWGTTLLNPNDDKEIAARLGGNMSPHRDGMLLQTLQFEDGIQGWSLLGGGVGNEQRRTIEYARRGPCALLLLAGDAIGDKATAEQSWGYPSRGKIGVEYSWAGNGVDLRTHIKVRHYKDSRIVRYGFRIDTDAATLEYLAHDDVWTAWQTELPMYNALGQWNIAKLVVDLDSRCYMRVELNGLAFDLTTVQASVAGIIDPSIVSVEVGVESRDTANAGIYVDEISLTDNERT